MVPRVAMLTTAGETFLIIGASVGSGVFADRRRHRSRKRRRRQRHDQGEEQLKSHALGILARSACLG